MIIGIIGFGRFGKLAVEYLAKDFQVLVYDRNNNIAEIKKMNATPVPLKEAANADIIIPCVPISAFKEILEEIKNIIKTEAVIIDVCSVKEYPITLMKEILPEQVQLLGTHPMFGPDSVFEGLEGRKIVLCRIRISDKNYNNIKEYLQSKKLIIIETTPEKHDQQIAQSLALTHTIGRTLLEFNAKNLEIDTEGYKRLMHILEVVKNDTWELFIDMNKYNPYAKKIREKFIQALKTIDKKLG